MARLPRPGEIPDEGDLPSSRREFGSVPQVARGAVEPPGPVRAIRASSIAGIASTDRRAACRTPSRRVVVGVSAGVATLAAAAIVGAVAGSLYGSTAPKALAGRASAPSNNAPTALPVVVQLPTQSETDAWIPVGIAPAAHPSSDAGRATIAAVSRIAAPSPCDPPYTIDSTGIKRFKVERLKESDAGSTSNIAMPSGGRDQVIAPNPCNPPYTIDSSGLKRYKRECADEPDPQDPHAPGATPPSGGTGPAIPANPYGQPPPAIPANPYDQPPPWARRDGGVRGGFGF
jgi:hypothetical protein